MLSLSAFLKHYIINIKHITTYSTHISIGFFVTCSLNDHSKYFESKLSHKHIILYSTIYQLLQFSWNSIQHKVLLWASKILHLPKIYKKNNYYSFYTNPYNPLYTIYISQFHISQQPHNKILVEFHITYNISLKSKNFQTSIPLLTQHHHNIHQDFQLAWNQIKHNVYIWTKKHILNPSPLFNSIYIPPKILN